MTAPSIKYFLQSAAATPVPQRRRCAVCLCLALQTLQSAPAPLTLQMGALRAQEGTLGEESRSSSGAGVSYHF